MRTSYSQYVKMVEFMEQLVVFVINLLDLLDCAYIFNNVKYLRIITINNFLDNCSEMTNTNFVTIWYRSFLYLQNLILEYLQF